MAAKVAEKLIILGDNAAGLLCRFHTMVEFKRPALFDNELKKFTDILIKNFPNFPDAATLTKTPGQEIFQKRSTEISTMLRDYYMTLSDLINFTDEAWKLLEECAKSLPDLKYELNVDLMTFYMQLWQRFCQLHIIVPMIPDAKLLLACYAKAYHYTSGNTEPNFQKIANYLKKYAVPVQTLRDDCAAALSNSIGNTIMHYFAPLAKWNEVKTLGDQKVFSVLEDAKVMGVPSGERNHLEIMMLDKYRQWVLWGFLICPRELHRPNALELLKLALKDCFVLTVFRDQVLQIHDDYEQLFKTYKHDKSLKFSLDTSKSKKYIQDAAKEYEVTIHYHAEMRNFLRLELRTLLSFFSEHPATLAPKIKMALCALQLARDEVIWYYRHARVKPAHASAKYAFPTDAKLSYLIHYVMQLTDLINHHKKTIQEYYLEFMQNLDVEKIQPEVNKFFQGARNLSSSVQGLIESIQKNMTDCKIDDTLEGLRLNWYRVSAALCNVQSGVAQLLYGPLSVAMTALVHHTRNIDCLPTQLRTHGSFMDLYWYRRDLFETLKENLKSAGGQAGHCMSLTKTLNHALHNVHRICPEEQAPIGKDICTMADGYLRTITIGAELLLKAVLIKTKQLRSQTRPMKVAARMQMSLDPNAPKQPQPGVESLMVNRRHKDVISMLEARRGIAEICNALLNNDTLIVYNIEFIPREYLYEVLTHNIRQTLRSCVIPEERKSFDRPTVILTNFRDAIHAYQAVERNLNINLSDIVREVLLSEFTDDQHGGAGDPIAVEEKEKPPSEKTEEKKDDPATKGIIHTISQWYTNLFARDLGEWGVSWAPIKRCFVARPVPSPIDKNNKTPAIQLDAESYTDFNELVALSTLIGPYGVRVLDRALLNIVSKCVSSIQGIIVNNSQFLGVLAGRFTEPQLWAENVAKLLNLEDLIKQATIMGCILVFRKQLRAALGEVASAKAPHVYKAVKLAFNHVHDCTEVDPIYAAMDYLAMDVGLDVGEADHALRMVLQKYRAKAADAGMWALLPEMFGLSFTSIKWRTAAYSVAQEGFIQNYHCMTEALRAMIVSFHRMVSRSELLEVPARITNDMERLVKCGAYTILHMTARQNEGYNVSGAMIFLEQFIQRTDGRLQMSLLEECFPYTLLRTNFLRIYQRQSATGGMIEEEKEEKKTEAPAAGTATTGGTAGPSAASPSNNPPPVNSPASPRGAGAPAGALSPRSGPVASGAPPPPMSTSGAPPPPPV